MKDTRSRPHAATGTSQASNNGNTGGGRFSPKHGVTYEETRLPPEKEERWIQHCLQSARIGAFVMYGTLAVMCICLFLLYRDGVTGVTSVYLGGAIALGVGLWVAKQHSQAGRAEFKKKKLVKLSGKLANSDHSVTDHKIDFLPVFFSSPSSKKARNYRGKQLEVEGYLSEKGVLYVLEVPKLGLSVQREIEEGEIPV